MGKGFICFSHPVSFFAFTNRIPGIVSSIHQFICQLASQVRPGRCLENWINQRIASVVPLSTDFHWHGGGNSASLTSTKVWHSAPLFQTFEGSEPVRSSIVFMAS